MTETPGKGAGHQREGGGGCLTNSGLLDNKCQRKSEDGAGRVPRYLRLCICHSGVCENATKLPNSVPAGNTDVKTRGRKAMGKLSEPECLRQAREVAGKGPGAVC